MGACVVVGACPVEYGIFVFYHFAFGMYITLQRYIKKNDDFLSSIPTIVCFYERNFINNVERVSITICDSTWQKGPIGA